MDEHTIAIARAVEVFVRGVAFTRSFTHPYVAERVGPLWVMRDGPRKRGNYRTEEWVSVDSTPETVDPLVRAAARGRYVICALCAPTEPFDRLRDRYKALGYRLITTEPLMVHNLTQIPAPAAPAAIERVLAAEVATRLNKAVRKRQILPEQLTDAAPLRQYVALVDGELVGWVRSIVVDQATWCSDMYVSPEFRRRGIARALLSRLLHDDRAYGAQEAILLASHTGARLYTTVGYEQIGTLLIFSPTAS